MGKPNKRVDDNLRVLYVDISLIAVFFFFSE